MTDAEIQAACEQAIFAYYNDGVNYTVLEVDIALFKAGLAAGLRLAADMYWVMAGAGKTHHARGFINRCHDEAKRAEGGGG